MVPIQIKEIENVLIFTGNEKNNETTNLYTTLSVADDRMKF